ncbi:MAG: UDP-N-acetylglucosamine 2-epimerase (non-hydrolyzing) [Planctomycetes bacterium]|nr:UDP-N-acetylglucosamine 2-epimerase (non-hydrolyzing) [Planctomycetota bacterium]
MKVLLVAGARPNFIKIAPLVAAMDAHGGFVRELVHTGQHFDDSMSAVFFAELGIPRPDHDLKVGSGSHARQTAEIMSRFEPVLRRSAPDVVVVVGDVNSTLACALTAAKEGIPVAHVEAGLRSFDRRMPEELNRMVTDALSDLLFVSEPAGVTNLLREGLGDRGIHLVGNVMIDTLRRFREAARERQVARRLGLVARQYAVVTLHRPSNVDDPEVLGGILRALGRISAEVPVILPAHPRARGILMAAGAEWPGLRVIEPLGYLDFLDLISDAMVAITDSGGVQEETTVLGVPCLTVRENTERPITIEQGSNRLVGTDALRIIAEFERVRKGEVAQGRVPDLWDGGAARRIVEVLASREV